MKKRTASVLFAAALGAAAIPVYAAENTESQETIINAKVASVYELTIPAKTTIEFNKTSTNLNGMLKVSGNVDVNEKVTVTATPNALKNASPNEELPYTLMNGQAAFTTADWNETELREGLEGDGSGKELQLSVAITEAAWTAAKAGSYNGSITFTAALK